MTVEEHIARGLARRAGDSEEKWGDYLEASMEAIVGMRQAVPDVLANIRRRVDND